MIDGKFFDRRTSEFRSAAIQFREIALQVDRLAQLFDDSAALCPGCGSTTYLFWAQRQLRARVTGVSERLREIADTVERRSRDVDFVGEEAGTPAALALTAKHAAG